MLDQTFFRRRHVHDFLFHFSSIFTPVEIPPVLIYTHMWQPAGSYGTYCPHLSLWPFSSKTAPQFPPRSLRQLSPTHRTCPVLPIPSPGLGRSLAFMRSQCWASGSMTNCLVDRTDGPFYVPPPPWIPLEIFIQKLLEPFTPHQTLDPKEKHAVDASTKEKNK